MDQVDWSEPCMTGEEIEAEMEAARAWDEASCAEHYWCALRWFNETFVGPEIDIDIPF